MTLTQVSTGGIKDGQVHTADLADAQITAGKLHADALDHTYTLGASGTDHYTFTGEGLTGAVNDATLYLTRGKTYRFVNGNSSGAHPFRIQSVAGAGGTEYNTGVTNNAGAGGSTIIFEVPHDAPDVLYYICTSHATMNGIFYVTGALADGTVTTAKLADDAVTDAKIANSINTAIAANTAKTTNATHTGEVTGGTALTIADDVVDEANLKVSNSPTNGYMLTAQSGNTGGLTWAAAPSGVGGATGVDFNDSVKAKFGTGNDFVIFHDGTYNYVDCVNDRQLRIVNDTQGANELMFAATPNGAVELYHNNTKQCETSANGLAFPAGKGIDFSATTDADLQENNNTGMNPTMLGETLETYEHGTWTPKLHAYDHTGGAGWGFVVDSSGNVPTGTARYVRVGRLVFASYEIENVTWDSNWTYFSIQGVPYGANEYNEAQGGHFIFSTNSFNYTSGFMGGSQWGSGGGLYHQLPTGQSNANLISGSSGKNIRGSMTFYTTRGA